MQSEYRPDFRGTERFRLISLLGFGGMGVVYEAHDRQLGCRVALKLLRSITPGRIVRFKNEFRSLQYIHHRNLVSLGELVEDHGHLFFTMELVDGVDIISHTYGASRKRITCPHVNRVAPDAPTVDSYDNRDWVPANELCDRYTFSSGQDGIDDTRVRSAFEQLAQGLMTLHAHGKIHRDVKPSNILVTEKDRVVLLDFGLIADVSEGQVVERGAVGTAGYMSPEQACGLPVDAASDWYSFGAILCEVLTGTAPPSIAEGTNRHSSVGDASAGAKRDLLALCHMLLRPEPCERPVGAAVLRVLRGLDEPAVSVVPATRGDDIFVGRHAELEILERSHERAVREGPLAIVVAGDSGVGKTTLVNHFLQKIAAEKPDVLIFRGSCSERESISYKALDRIMEQATEYLSQSLDDSTVQSGGVPISDVTIGRLGRAFPVMMRLLRHGLVNEAVASIDLQVERVRLLKAAHELIRALGASRHLILWIDDWHWVDADSVAVLSAITGGASAPRMTLILSQRTGSAAPNLEVATEHLTLRDLDPKHSRELAASFLTRHPPKNGAFAAIVDRIAEEAHGRPLFVLELARHVRDHPQVQPRRLRFSEVVAKRVAALDESSRRMVELVSLAAGPVPVSVLAAAVVALGTALEPTDLPAIVGRLHTEHFIRSEAEGFGTIVYCYHERIANIVVSSVEPKLRLRFHEALALALEAGGSNDYEMLALHFREAGCRAPAFRYFVRAAETATAALAFDRAARLYRLSLGLCDPAEQTVLWERIGDALASAGRGRVAANAYAQAANSAVEERQIELTRRSADQLFRSGYVDEAIALLDKVPHTMGLAVPRSSRLALVQVIWERARLRLRGLGFKLRRSTDVDARALVRVDLCWTVGIGLSTVDNLKGACLQTRHLRLALDMGEPFRLVRALAAEAGSVAVVGVHTRMRTKGLLQSARDLAEQLGDSYVFGFTHLATAICEFLGGNWRKARDSATSAEVIFEARPAGASWELASARMFGVWAAFYEGDWSAFERVAELISEAESRGDRYAATVYRIGLCNLTWLLRGDIDQAWREVRTGEQDWSREGFHFQHYWILLSCVHAELWEGNGLAAYRRVAGAWNQMRRELLFRAEHLRLEVLWLRARAALAASKQTSDPFPLVRDARACASELQRAPLAWANQAGKLISAALHYPSNVESAVAALRSPQRENSQGEPGVLALIANARLEQILGSTRKEPSQWLEFAAKHRLANSCKLLDLFSPGFDP